MRLLTLSVALAAAVAALPGASMAFPDKPIRLIVPFPPGGAADVTGRIFADALSAALNGTIVVESRPGAGGTIGAAYAANEPADGYTLLFASTGAMSTAMIMQPDISYDAQTDFTPVSLVVSVPTILVTTKKGPPLDSVDALTTYAVENPGALTYGSTGSGTTQHLSGLLFEEAIGAQLTHIPYRGQDMLIPDLVSGTIQLAFTNITSALGQVHAEELSPLAVALDERWSDLPDVPTFAEAGLPTMRVSSWLGVFVPEGTPEDVVAQLEQASIAALNQEGVHQKLLDIGVQPIGSTRDELAEFHATDIALWRNAIALTGDQ